MGLKRPKNDKLWAELWAELGQKQKVMGLNFIEKLKKIENKSEMTKKKWKPK